jgi:murein DD-endopeptidase MepM/ murein hydrolase activator NlpD
MTAPARRRVVAAAVAVAAVLPSVAGAEPPGPTAATRVHEVKAGETLFGIAQHYGVSVTALARANGLELSAQLRIGRRLVVPPLPAPTTVQALKLNAGAIKTGVGPRAAVPPKTVLPWRGRQPAPDPMNLFLGVPEIDTAAIAFAWPVDGALTSVFGRRRSGWHRGIDIKADPGAPVLASAPGLVVASGVEPRYGRVVKIEHEHGFMTVYAHNSRNLVRTGDWVVTGQMIATVGMTGRATTHHVHFEIRRDGRVYNPLYLLPLPPRTVQLDERLDGDVDE